MLLNKKFIIFCVIVNIILFLTSTIIDLLTKENDILWESVELLMFSVLQGFVTILCVLYLLSLNVDVFIIMINSFDFWFYV